MQDLAEAERVKYKMNQAKTQFKKREIIKLKADDYSYKEIAETLGISEKQVDNKLAYIRNKIQDFKN